MSEYLLKSVKKPKKDSSKISTDCYRLAGINSKSICRVCLQEGNIPIYGDEIMENISENLKLYAGIEIRETDKFPKNLCHTCYEQLQSAIKFRQTAQKSDRLLKKSVQKRKTPTSLAQISERLLKKSLQKCNTSTSLQLTDDTIIGDKDIFKQTLSNNETKFHCIACNIDFTDANSYGSHMFEEGKHDKLKDKCPFCSRDFPCIKKHLSLHRHYKTIMCDICNQKFIQTTYYRHRESHTNILPYKCSKCPYQGRYSRDFKIHLRKHTGERPYLCSSCDASFINKSNLNRHLLTHKKEYDFVCEECNKGYFSQHDLDSHIKVDHIGLREHLCNECGKSFGYRGNLMKHQLKVHKREKLRSGKLPVYLRAPIKNGEEIASK